MSIRMNREEMRRAIGIIIHKLQGYETEVFIHALLDTIESQLGVGKECICKSRGVAIPTKDGIHCANCGDVIRVGALLCKKEEVSLPEPIVFTSAFPNISTLAGRTRFDTIEDKINEIITYLSAKANQDK